MHGIIFKSQNILEHYYQMFKESFVFLKDSFQVCNWSEINDLSPFSFSPISFSALLISCFWRIFLKRLPPSTFSFSKSSELSNIGKRQLNLWCQLARDIGGFNCWWNALKKAFNFASGQAPLQKLEHSVDDPKSIYS